MIAIAITSLVVALHAAAAIRVQRRRGRFEAARATSFGVGAALLLIATPGILWRALRSGAAEYGY